MTEKHDLDVLSIRITASLTKAIEKFLEIDSHVTKSDFVRDAIREKIRRDAPHIIEDMMKRGEEDK